MALGVDSAAHVGALEQAAAARRRAPVAVLAGGADVAYPASRRRLHARLVERGCVVSELPPGFTAFRWCFVARNRLIAGLAAPDGRRRGDRAVGLAHDRRLRRRSSAARSAPCPARSPRASRPARTPCWRRAPASSATRATCSTSCSARPRRARRTLPPPVPIEPRLRRLLDAIERGHGSLAELTSDPDATRQVLQDLTELELRGLVRREFGGRYVRALDGRP